MLSFLKRLKPYLRWLIFGLVMVFLAKTLRDNWYEVATLRLTGSGFAALAIALGITLMAHIWAGWVWGWIVQAVDLPIPTTWGVQVYLKTNIAKYLPGNVWHFVSRVRAVQLLGAPLSTASLSVLLEPALLAAAALLIALFSSPLTWGWWQLQIPLLLVILAGLHPRVLNPLLLRLGQLKASTLSRSSPAAQSPGTDLPPEPTAPLTVPLTDQAQANAGQAPQADIITPSIAPRQPASSTPQLRRYPLRPLLGEIGFIGLRGAGFLLVLLALTPVGWDQLLPLLSAFSLAWLAGLVVPGAPGGIGVFELVAIALLDGQFSPAILISAVALYRLISTLAEAGGAGLVWLDEQLNVFNPRWFSRSDS